MEINRANFDPSIFQKAVHDCDFVTVDLEFSGLSLKAKDRRHGFDSTEEIYAKMKDLCSTFFAFQIGLCTFQWDSENQKYLACPFNFYVFPSSKFKDSTLSFQASTLNFLTEHNMEWHKVFTTGLHYWQRNRREELETLAKEYLTKSKENHRSYWYRLGSKSEEDRQEILQHVTEFLDKPYKEKEVLKLKPNRNKVCWSATCKSVTSLCHGRENVRAKVSGKDKVLTITKYLPLEKDDSQSNSSSILLEEQPSQVSDTTEDLTSKMEELKIDPDEQLNTDLAKLIREEYGFTVIMDILVEAKKPLIGHNMIFDIMFLYHQFIDEFPESYDEFTRSWASNFPLTYDTKLLSSYCSAIKKTWLKEAFDQCLEQPTLRENLKFEYHPDFKMYDEEVQEHEAAYDAFMTGVVFATIAKQKEIIHEYRGKLDSVEEVQELRKKKTETEDKEEKNQIYKRLEEIENEHFSSTREECKNKPIETQHLMDLENKVVVISDKNRVFYFGTNENEIKQAKNLKVNADKVLWIRLDPKEADVEKIFELAKDMGDVHVQRDDKNAYYVEFQTIYDNKLKIKDLIDQFREELGGN